MIEVEIKGHYGQYIKGYLQRLLPDNKCVIVYADDQKTEEVIPLGELRLPPEGPAECGSFVEDQQVEALLPIVLKTDSKDVELADALASFPHPQEPPTSRLASPVACLSCPSWWPCVIQKSRDNFFVVHLRPVIPEVTADTPVVYLRLANAIATVSEILERSSIRRASADTSPLNSDMFHRHVITLSTEVVQCSTDPAVHDVLIRNCGGPASLCVEADRLVIISPSAEVIRVTMLLEETYLRMFRQKAAVIKSITQSKRTQESFLGPHDQPLGFQDATATSGDENHFVEKFKVPQFLMGLAIGTQGANIRSVRNFPGVVRISIQEPPPSRSGPNWSNNGDDDDTCSTFTVVAETLEAAKSARSMLEYCRLCLLVPKRLIGRILGSRTSNIFAINEKSGVKHIHLEENRSRLPTNPELPVAQNSPSVKLDRVTTVMKITDPHANLARSPDDSDDGGFFIVGTRDSVEKARLLISFQIDCIFDLEKLEAEKIDLLRELQPQHTAPAAAENEGYDEGTYQMRRGGGYRRFLRGREHSGRGSSLPFNRDGERHYSHPPGSGDPCDDEAYMHESMTDSVAGGGRGQTRGGGRRGGSKAASRGQRNPAGHVANPRSVGDVLDNVDHLEENGGFNSTSNGTFKLEDQNSRMNATNRRSAPRSNRRRGERNSHQEKPADQNVAGSVEHANGENSADGEEPTTLPKDTKKSKKGLRPEYAQPMEQNGDAPLVAETTENGHHKGMH